MRFVIFGGGCYGAFYARQLLRAHRAGALRADRILVVDQDPDCQAARDLPADPAIQLCTSSWDDFLDDHLEELPASADDQLVPPPFTPHLALAWLLRSLHRELPNLETALERFGAAAGTPFERQDDGGPLLLSHADWLCPVHCIEPHVCPAIRAPRAWDLEDTARELTLRLDQAGQDVDQIHLFRCHHLAFGVGTYPAADVIRARNEIRSAALLGPVRALVGTISHCHGALNLLRADHGTVPV